MLKFLLLFLNIILITDFVQAQIQIPRLFGDHMVLQRNAQVKIWGKASANEKIQIQIDNWKDNTKADKNGDWVLTINAHKEGGPFIMTIRGKKEKIKFSDIYFGDVWLAGGQSNMEWSVRLSKNADQEMRQADYPLIRHIKVGKSISNLPKDDIISGKWEVTDSTTVGKFSAVAFFFAREIFEKTGVPIGIINSTWGGTNIETWISHQGFESSPTFSEMIRSLPKVNQDSLASFRIEKAKKRLAQLQGSAVVPINGFQESMNEKDDWPTIFMPQNWEEQSIGNLDGEVWLKKIFYLDKVNAKSTLLNLGMIDDDDSTFVNGSYVGSTVGWNIVRTYSIPDSILKTGKNVILVKVTDTQGGGGLYSPKDEVWIQNGLERVSLAGNWSFHVSDVIVQNTVNSFPSLAYNAMIHPLIPFEATGIIWYQGESNATRAYEYRTSFPLLIQDWRTQWNKPNWPFYFVQLATFETQGDSNTGSAWAELREAQTKTLSAPNTGMVVTTDIGNPRDIHPTDKQTVGKRLAAHALNNVYGFKQVHSGPLFKSMKVDGSKIYLQFSDIGSGLMTPNKYGYVMGFEIAGKDSVFHFAKAYIEADKVVVYHSEIRSPLFVNYGWSGNAEDCNLYNKEGFPAIPFRTHEIRSVTKDSRYQIGF